MFVICSPLKMIALALILVLPVWSANAVPMTYSVTGGEFNAGNIFSNPGSIDGPAGPGSILSSFNSLGATAAGFDGEVILDSDTGSVDISLSWEVERDFYYYTFANPTTDVVLFSAGSQLSLQYSASGGIINPDTGSFVGRSQGGGSVSVAGTDYVFETLVAFDVGCQGLNPACINAADRAFFASLPEFQIAGMPGTVNQSPLGWAVTVNADGTASFAAPWMYSTGGLATFDNSSMFLDLTNNGVPGVVPEPASVVLLLSGLIITGLGRRRRSGAV